MWRGRSRTTSRTTLSSMPPGHASTAARDARVHLLRRQPARRDRRQIDELARRRERMERVRARREIVLDDALARHAGLLLLDPLAPRVRARVVERAAVELVRRDPAIHVIVAERDVVPRATRAARPAGSPASRISCVAANGPSIPSTSPCSSSTFQRRVPGGRELRSRVLIVGDREHREIELRELERARLAHRRRASRAARRAGGCSPSPSSAACRDCRRPSRPRVSAAPRAAARTGGYACRIAVFVGRTWWNTSPAMSTTSGASSITLSIAARERLRDVRLALIDPARSQPLILAVAEMQVGEVDEAQSRAGSSSARRAKQLRRAEVGSLRPLAESLAVDSALVHGAQPLRDPGHEPHRRRRRGAGGVTTRVHDDDDPRIGHPAAHAVDAASCRSSRRVSSDAGSLALAGSDARRASRRTPASPPCVERVEPERARTTRPAPARRAGRLAGSGISRVHALADARRPPWEDGGHARHRLARRSRGDGRRAHRVRSPPSRRRRRCSETRWPAQRALAPAPPAARRARRTCAASRSRRR